MKNKILIIVLLFMISSNIVSLLAIGENSGTESFPILKLYSGLRAQAIGENYTAVDEGVSTIYYNPAGLVGNTKVELSAEYMIWLDILTKSNLSFVKPNLFKFGTMGIGLDYVTIPYEKRDVENDNLYVLKSVNIGTLNFSLAKIIREKIFLGISLKFIFQDFGLGDSKYNNTSGIFMDIGGIYKILEKTNLGIVIKNLGKEFTNTNEDKIPAVLKIGQATKLLNSLLLLANDIDYSFNSQTLSVGIGGEYKLSQHFFPRIGYKYIITNNNLGIINGLNIGFGIKYKNINFDYVFTPQDDLGNTHRVAVGYSF